MQHFYGLEDVALDAAWLTIGSFDGVHIGHRQIIEKLTAGAHKVGAPAVVLTFSPHPAVVLRGVQSAYYLTTPEEKAHLLGELGVDIVITHPFNQEVAAIEAEDFMRTLNQHLKLEQLWIGYDFALGRNRGGDAAALRKIGLALGYRVEEVNPYQVKDRIVSSSRIRKLLEEGKVEEAADYLNRPYQVSGLVIKGDGRGKTIGIPTANIEIAKEKMMPAAGVYACYVWVEGQRYPAVTNVGVRPTFESDPVPPRVEPHILEFDRQIYGKTITVEFIARLRAEKKFDGIQALVSQIHIDIDQARQLFAEDV
ncbi:MAG: bifunctional riboflavin kinase/FAD synthetase [Anaerolineae bacterium]|nr:bifunctional riboflavin kinase/FAD synthetase [Anaerolineae bacterium]